MPSEIKIFVKDNRTTITDIFNIQQSKYSLERQGLSVNLIFESPYYSITICLNDYNDINGLIKMLSKASPDTLVDVNYVKGFNDAINHITQLANNSRLNHKS